MADWFETQGFGPPESGVGSPPAAPITNEETGEAARGYPTPRGGPEGQQWPGLPRPASTATPSDGRTYNPVPGWETDKLNNPAHTTVKYEFMRAVQRLGGSYAQLRNNWGPVMEALRAQYPNIRAVGDDKIDFGDGFGPIDALTSGGEPPWMPASQLGAGADGAGGGA